MILKKAVIPILCSIVIASGCSSSTNKLDLDDEVFEKANSLLQYSYTEMLDMEADMPSEYKELLSWSHERYESGEFSSEDEEILFTNLHLLATQRTQLAFANVSNKISGKSDENESIKTEIEKRMKEIEDKFGISYKK